ncbi:hypothetical protein E4191_10865 [Paracoccus liaowanqingii]|uniref:Uncharacterized protein n=1 Tax=Paracoccus liaowanqingii TaxID=2560053 RepID=A0A4P7HN22_9RHOB|nr:hypothetical protein [Paracoccus liaowanqingii]QBX35140.1 hypothetical protein E4191_10865 [Paracoccus liaowanqingii]
MPGLYLKGIFNGDFEGALEALLGPSKAELSSTTIWLLKAEGWVEYERGQPRDLGAQRTVYVWVDGYFQPRGLRE